MSAKANNVVEQIRGKSKILTVVEKQAYTSLLSGVTSLTLSVFFLLRTLWKKRARNLDTLDRDVMRDKRLDYLHDIWVASLGVYTGYRMLTRYEPTTTEKSLAILIAYLKDKAVLDDRVYDVLKNLKPYRIEYSNVGALLRQAGVN